MGRKYKIISGDGHAGIDDMLRRKILVENICAHIGLDPDADITETPQS